MGKNITEIGFNQNITVVQCKWGLESTVEREDEFVEGEM